MVTGSECHENASLCVNLYPIKMLYIHIIVNISPKRKSVSLSQLAFVFCFLKSFDQDFDKNHK